MFCDISSQCSQENKFFDIKSKKNIMNPFLYRFFFHWPSPSKFQVVGLDLSPAIRMTHLVTYTFQAKIT